MKQLIKPLFLLIIALAYACKQTDTGPTDRVTLADKQSARLASGVSVQVDSLIDSRCPSDPNVVCAWQGNVVVFASLTKGDTKQVRLVLGPDPGRPAALRPDSTGVVLTDQTYKVILREVSPFPSLLPTATKKAVIQVTRL